MGWVWEGISAKRRQWRMQRAEIEEAAGELPAKAGKATTAATVGKWESPPNKFNLSAAKPRLHQQKKTPKGVFFVGGDYATRTHDLARVKRAL